MLYDLTISYVHLYPRFFRGDPAFVNQSVSYEHVNNVRMRACWLADDFVVDTGRRRVSVIFSKPTNAGSALLPLCSSYFLILPPLGCPAGKRCMPLRDCKEFQETRKLLASSTEPNKSLQYFQQIKDNLCGTLTKRINICCEGFRKSAGFATNSYRNINEWFYLLNTCSIINYLLLRNDHRYRPFCSNLLSLNCRWRNHSENKKVFIRKTYSK